MAALAVYAFSLNAVNAYHWVLFHRPSPPDSPYFEGDSLDLLSSLCMFSRVARVSAGPRERSGLISSMIAVVNALSYLSLVRNPHAPVQRLRVDDHGGVVLGHGPRQLALGLGEPLADGEHAVDNDSVYALLYLALRFYFG